MKTKNYRFYKTLLVLFFATFLASVNAQTAPPIAPVHPDTTNIHGVQLIDNWAWLKQRENPELAGVLELERKYTEAGLKPSRKLSKKIYREFAKSVPKVHESYPYSQEGYSYYTRELSGKAYSAHYRVKDSGAIKAELILDENKLASGNKFFQLDVLTISRDTWKLAYSADFEGNEQFRLYIKDLSSGKTQATDIDNVSQAIWLQDNQTLLLTRTNPRLQTDSVWLYHVKTKQLILLYHEEDQAFDLSIYHSSGRDLIFIQSTSKNSSQTWYIKTSELHPVLYPLFERTANRHLSPDYLNGVFYTSSDHLNPDYGIYSFIDAGTAEEDWQTVVSGRDGEPISGFLLFDNKMLVLRRHSGFEQIDLIDLASHELIRSIAPQEPTNLDFWVNTDPHSSSFYYSYENELTPYTIVRQDLSTGWESIVYRSLPAVKIDYTQYKTELHWVAAEDGKLIPLRLISRKDLSPAMAHPLWLYAYGAYGDYEDPYYSNTLFSLLDRGFIYAVAHVRGGGELGKAWYDGGRTLNKINTVTDFISCMDYLIASRYTTSEQLVIEGGSAGGILIGSVVCRVPGKMKVAIADVPFVDVINSMLDSELPLTVQEYEEWGNPSIEQDFRYMLSYSPYDNTIAQEYPNILVNTAWNDIRVGYWEGLKWVQKLRSMNTGTNPILFRMLMNEGHTGTNDRYQSLKNYAELMAYAIHLILEK